MLMWLMNLDFAGGGEAVEEVEVRSRPFIANCGTLMGR